MLYSNPSALHQQALSLPQQWKLMDVYHLSEEQPERKIQTNKLANAAMCV